MHKTASSPNLLNMLPRNLQQVVRQHVQEMGLEAVEKGFMDVKFGRQLLRAGDDNTIS